ncbi:MAG: DNA polymerase III subunit epsilon [Rickettsiales bacterium]|nr:MAG: DNA polymerase III subunit epsilon [Rickettsiales bacterium]
MTEREIILDTETTGLSPKDGHRIVEIGALEMVNKVLTGKKFHQYINPERDMPEGAYKVHGISYEFLQDKPLFSDIYKEFMDFIEGGKLVIHNAQFDIRFLNHELSLVKAAPLNLEDAIDTLAMARRRFPGTRVNLDALCKRFKVDNSSREFHGALKDAALLSEVYVELTGGRQVTFSMDKKDVKLARDSGDKFGARAIGNKIVIQPTEEEKNLHNKFLEKL